MLRFLGLALGLAGAAILLGRARDRSGPGLAPVRASGPTEMRDPPRGWTDLDERSDESFPASDPPGTY